MYLLHGQDSKQGHEHPRIEVWPRRLVPAIRTLIVRAGPATPLKRQGQADQGARIKYSLRIEREQLLAPGGEPLTRAFERERGELVGGLARCRWGAPVEPGLLENCWCCILVTVSCLVQPLDFGRQALQLLDLPQRDPGPRPGAKAPSLSVA